MPNTRRPPCRDLCGQPLRLAGVAGGEGEKMKVGILTFSYSWNPGSYLQAYALQEKVRELGASCNIINYQNPRRGKEMIGVSCFCPPVSKWRPKKVVSWIGQLITYPVKIRKYRRFQDDCFNGYPCKAVGLGDLPALNNEFDRFLVGSDQVWNFANDKWDAPYFLDFVTDDSKKIAYAASFGTETLPAGKEGEILEYIRHFKSISVRETQGMEILSSAGIAAELALDPSLLWTRDKYEPLVKTSPRKKKYLFLYLRAKDAGVEAVAKKMAADRGLEIVRVYKAYKCIHGMPVATVGPCEWLGYVKNAEVVVTNSFHGICFSLLFEKEFYIANLVGASAERNSRLTNMMQMFGLQDCAIRSDGTTQTPVDYARINPLLEKMRTSSLRYLEKAVFGGVGQT